MAFPMIISAGSLAVMQFADRVFLAWYDPMTVGAAFASGQFIWALASFPFSIVAYAVAFVSQYNGAKEYGRIGRLVWQGIFLGIAVTPLFFLVYPWTGQIFRLFDHAPEVIELQKTYFYWSLWGIGFVIASQALEAFFVGRKKMKTVMTVSLAAVLLNMVLNYIMIFGVLRFPRMGIAGAALATSICQILRFLILFVLVLIDEFRSGSVYGFWHGCRILPSELCALLRYGGMGGCENFLETLSFTLFVFLLGQLGDVVATASAVAVNLNAMTFLPVVGIGTAVMTMVGNALGEGDSRLARRSTYSAGALGILFTGFFVLLFLLAPEIFLSVYASGNPEEFAPYYSLTKNLLRFVAIYLFFDTINIIFCSAIRGAGDTKFVMITTLVFVPFLTVFLWLGVSFFHFGVYWCWTVLTGFISLMGTIFFLRFIGGTWMGMRLIDSEDVSAAHDGYQS
ncbi:MAG: MATE family efflux transporter [Thermoguttaceae bacterium]